MFLRRLKFTLASLAALALLTGPGLTSSDGVLGETTSAEARSKAKPKPSKRRAVKRGAAKKGTKSSKKRRGKRRRRGRRKSSGHAVAQSKLRTTPLEQPSGKLWVYSENLKEEVQVQLYDAEGDIDDAALATLDHEFRCRRTK